MPVWSHMARHMVPCCSPAGAPPGRRLSAPRPSLLLGVWSDDLVDGAARARLVHGHSHLASVATCTASYQRVPGCSVGAGPDVGELAVVCTERAGIAAAVTVRVSPGLPWCGKSRRTGGIDDDSIRHRTRATPGRRNAVLERRRANRARFGTCASVVRTLNRFRAAVGASAAEQKGHRKPPLRVHASSLSEHHFSGRRRNVDLEPDQAGRSRTRGSGCYGRGILALYVIENGCAIRVCDFGGGPGAGLVCGGREDSGGLAIGFDRPVGTTDVVGIKEVPPGLQFRRIEGAVPRRCASTVFGHEDGDAAGQRLAHARAEGSVLVGVRVEVESVGQIRRCGDRISGSQIGLPLIRSPHRPIWPTLSTSTRTPQVRCLRLGREQGAGQRHRHLRDRIRWMRIDGERHLRCGGIETWWDFLDTNNIGCTNWSVETNGETSAIFTTTANKTGPWTTAEITEPGWHNHSQLHTKQVCRDRSTLSRAYGIGRLDPALGRHSGVFRKSGVLISCLHELAMVVCGGPSVRLRMLRQQLGTG